MTAISRLRLLSTVLILVQVALLHAQDAPSIDHHQHLFSPALAQVISPPPPAQPTAPVTARDRR